VSREAEENSRRDAVVAWPVTGNDTAAGRQSNRRVEIILSDDAGSIVKR
jgi:hypothetical protein